MIIAALALAFLAGGQEAKDWTQRQVQLIKLSNAVLDSDSWALMNQCKVQDGHARYDAGVSKLKALLPQLKNELGDYAVYEIFVLRAPMISPQALPPAKCKPLKKVDPDREAIMGRFEQAVSALAEGVALPVIDAAPQ